MLSKIDTNAINMFADTFGKHIDNFNKEVFVQESIALKQRVRGKSVIVPKCDAVMDRWYDSLNIEDPDYSVYSDINVLQDVWVCWALYSRVYLKDIQRRTTNDIPIIESMGKIKCVLDIGNGIGYSTAGLSELFPKASIHGLNVKDSFQYKICKQVSKKYGFKMHHDIKKLGKVSLLFASEYFEHHHDPVDHLNEVISITEPKNIIIANSFGTRSIGHFIDYVYQGKVVSGKEINSIFNKRLSYLGYKKQKTTCWNNRPMFWKKLI